MANTDYSRVSGGTDYPGGGYGTDQTSDAGSGGFLQSLMGILGKIGGVAGGVAKAGQGVGNVLGLIPRPNESKQRAAGVQQNLENSALALEQQVNAGTMDADAALNALNTLIVRAAALSGGDLQYAGLNASPILTQVKANIESKRTAGLNKPIGEAGLSGTPQFQREQFSTAIRNALGGHDTSGLSGSPVGQLLSKAPDPLDRLGDVTSKVNEAFPTANNQDFVAKLRDQVAKFTATPPRY